MPLFAFSSFWCNWNAMIWAATWQNQQNECAPSEDSDQPGHLSLRLAHTHFVCFVMSWLIYACGSSSTSWLFLFRVYNTALTHISLASFICDIGKQCRPRSDATERGVWLGSTLFAYGNFYQKQTDQTLLKLEIDSSIDKDGKVMNRLVWFNHILTCDYRRSPLSELLKCGREEQYNRCTL